MDKAFEVGTVVKHKITGQKMMVLGQEPWMGCRSGNDTVRAKYLNSVTGTYIIDYFFPEELEVVDEKR